MFMVETDCDVPGFREDPKDRDDELKERKEEERARAEAVEAMTRDMPYVDYALALTRFLEVASLHELRHARRQIDAAIVAKLMQTYDIAEAAKVARLETKEVMREFKIPDPTRKTREDAGKKRKP